MNKATIHIKSNSWRITLSDHRLVSNHARADYTLHNLLVSAVICKPPGLKTGHSFTRKGRRLEYVYGDIDNGLVWTHLYQIQLPSLSPRYHGTPLTLLPGLLPARLAVQPARRLMPELIPRMPVWRGNNSRFSNASYILGNAYEERLRLNPKKLGSSPHRGVGCVALAEAENIQDPTTCLPLPARRMPAPPGTRSGTCHSSLLTSSCPSLDLGLLSFRLIGASSAFNFVFRLSLADE